MKTENENVNQTHPNLYGNQTDYSDFGVIIVNCNPTLVLLLLIVVLCFKIYH